MEIHIYTVSSTIAWVLKDIVQVIVARLNWGVWIKCTPINVLQLFCWAHDPLSSLDYPMITYTHPAASNLPIKTLVAKQWPTMYNVHTCNSCRMEEIIYSYTCRGTKQTSDKNGDGERTSFVQHGQFLFARKNLLTN